MKKGALLQAFLCAALLLSCVQKAENPAQASSPASSLPLISDARSAFCLADDMVLWEISEGKLKQKATLQLGEKVSLLGKRVTAVQSGKERAFLEAATEPGVTGWVREDLLASNSILAVVSADEVVVYSQARNTGATGIALPFMTVFAIQRESAAQAFVRITVYDRESQKVRRNVFLRNEGISSRLSEVESAILSRLADQTQNRKQREAFLTSALKDYPTSAFAGRIREQLGLTGAVPSGEGTVTAGGTYVTTEERVNVLSAPDDSAAAVVATLSKGQSVQVAEKTSQSFRIGSLSAPWYRIKDPPGWVFGTFLEQAP